MLTPVLEQHNRYGETSPLILTRENERTPKGRLEQQTEVHSQTHSPSIV